MSTKLGLNDPPLRGLHPSASARILKRVQQISKTELRALQGLYARSNTVRRGSRAGVTEEDASAEQVDIQEMVEHVHVVRSRERTRDAIDRAREGVVSRVKRRLPDLVAERKTPLALQCVP